MSIATIASYRKRRETANTQPGCLSPGVTIVHHFVEEVAPDDLQRQADCLRDIIVARIARESAVTDTPETGKAGAVSPAPASEGFPL